MMPRREPQPDDVPWLHGRIVGAIINALPMDVRAADPEAGWTELSAASGRVVRITVEEVTP